MDNLAFDIDQPDEGLLPPSQNTMLLGHEKVEQLLLQNITAGRLPHAIILSGPQGIGKATLAFRLARYLLSGKAEEDGGLFGDAPAADSLYVSADDPVTHRIVAGGHMDLLVLAPPEDDDKKKTVTRTISVEEVRKVNPFLSKTAGEGGWRIVIVDGAEYMNRNGQNALLKILEEPPEKTVLVLTTAEPGKLLPTIHSRCRMIPMSPLSDEDVKTLLSKALPELSEEDKDKITTISEGRIGYALSLYDLGGVDIYGKVLSLFENMTDADRHKLADEIAANQKQYHVFMEILIWFLARMAKEALHKTHDDIGPLTKYSPKTWFDMWDAVKMCYTRGEYANLDKRMVALQIFDILKR